jgi:hypothetical protein
MDEADVLGDKIAVMSTGKLRCVGSALFLKSRFGLGYTLTMVRDSSACDAERVTEAVRTHVPTAEILSQHGGELSYRLPFSASASFGPLLREIDEAQSKLGIGGYGMSVTSMEEVFLRLSQGQQAVVPGADVEELIGEGNNRPAKPDAVTVGIPASPPPSPPPPGGAKRPSSRAQVHNEPSLEPPTPLEDPAEAQRPAGRKTAPKRKQLAVLLRKRWHVAKRDVRGFLTQQVVPVVLIALVLLILTIEDPRVGPAIRLDASLYTTGSQVRLASKKERKRKKPRLKASPKQPCLMSLAQGAALTSLAQGTGVGGITPGYIRGIASNGRTPPTTTGPLAP